MPRKNNENNPLRISLKPVSLPRNVTPQRFLQRLIQHITEGKPLPRTWEVELSWRNPRTKFGRTKRWQTDEFTNAIAESRSGFVSIVHMALVRKLRRIL